MALSQDALPQPVLIIGGSSGIGLAVAERLQALEAQVIVADKRPTSTHEFFPCDVTDVREVERLAEEVPPIRALVLTAGVEQKISRLNEVAYEEIQVVVDTNLKGALYCLKNFLPILAYGSSVVVVGSIASVTTVPGNAVYAATKAALSSAIRYAAVENASRSIRVNAVIPGFVSTPLLDRLIAPEMQGDQLGKRVPMGRVATAEEIANVVIFLLSDVASYVTGIALRVDGGLSCTGLGLQRTVS